MLGVHTAANRQHFPVLSYVQAVLTPINPLISNESKDNVYTRHGNHRAFKSGS